MIGTLQRRISGGIWGILLCVSLLIPAPASGEPISGAEYRVKMGFIYHFIRFTQWPPETFPTPESPINFCIASANPAADILLSLQDKEVKGRKIDVNRSVTSEDVETCQILFIASDDEKFVQPMLESLKGRKILSIGEIKNFTRMGGVINFFVTRNQLRFEVNLDAAESAGLKFSSQLLMSADIVKKGEE
ncbi:YfiR family protein [Desulfococcus sp.]|uniref:YfiR family protein n=1 Tax=Desulfococcus sp. TaxID=2025834 RepID=UPI00359356FB